MLIKPTPEGLEVRCVGRCPMLFGGRPAKQGLVTPGETLTLKRQVVLFCTRRVEQMRPVRYLDEKSFGAFGVSDSLGIVGESPCVWELPAELQARLLRVLDRDGEYQRLGDATTVRADLRIVAATNRDSSELKHDVLARFAMRLSLPSLQDRREDIPLLARHLLQLAADDHPAVRRQFFDSRESRDEPRVHPDLMEALLTHDYTHHLRELEQLLWQAIRESEGAYIGLTMVFAASSAPGDRRPAWSPPPKTSSACSTATAAP